MNAQFKETAGVLGALLSALCVVIKTVHWFDKFRTSHPRLGFTRGGNIIRGGNAMIAGQTVRFQLVAVDRFGNELPNVKLSGAKLSGDAAFGDIKPVDGETDKFDLASNGKPGTDSLLGTATVTLDDGSTPTISGSLSETIEADDPAAVVIKEIGPVAPIAQN